MQGADEHVRDALRDELVAAVALAQPPRLAEVDNGRLQVRRGRVDEVEDDVVQRGGDIDELVGSLALRVGDARVREDGRRVEDLERVGGRLVVMRPGTPIAARQVAVSTIGVSAFQNRTRSTPASTSAGASEPAQAIKNTVSPASAASINAEAVNADLWDCGLGVVAGQTSICAFAAFELSSLRRLGELAVDSLESVERRGGASMLYQWY